MEQEKRVFRRAVCAFSHVHNSKRYFYKRSAVVLKKMCSFLNFQKRTVKFLPREVCQGSLQNVYEFWCLFRKKWMFHSCLLYRKYTWYKRRMNVSKYRLKLDSVLFIHEIFHSELRRCVFWDYCIFLVFFFFLGQFLKYSILLFILYTIFYFYSKNTSVENTSKLILHQFYTYKSYTRWYTKLSYNSLFSIEKTLKYQRIIKENMQNEI